MSSSTITMQCDITKQKLNVKCLNHCSLVNHNDFHMSASLVSFLQYYLHNISKESASSNISLGSHCQFVETSHNLFLSHNIENVRGSVIKAILIVSYCMA